MRYGISSDSLSGMRTHAGGGRGDRLPSGGIMARGLQRCSFELPSGADRILRQSSTERQLRHASTSRSLNTHYRPNKISDGPSKADMGVLPLREAQCLPAPHQLMSPSGAVSKSPRGGCHRMTSPDKRATSSCVLYRASLTAAFGWFAFSHIHARTHRTQ